MHTRGDKYGPTPQHWLKAVVLTGIILLLVGCDSSLRSPRAFEVERQGQLLDRSLLQSLSNKISQLEIHQRWSDGAIAEIQSIIQSSARLDAMSSAFAVCSTRYGPMFVRIDKAEPYIGAYKLQLTIGNPSAAIITDLAWELRWFESIDDPEFTEVLREIGQISGSWPNDFQAGSWTSVDLTIPCQEQHLNHLSLRLIPKAVSLRALP